MNLKKNGIKKYNKGDKSMNTIKKKIYYELSKHTEDGNITDLALYVRTPEHVKRATSKDQVNFFKRFGNCYVKETIKGIEWFSRFHNKTSESLYVSKLYESTETALKRAGLDLIELPAHCQKSFYGKAKIVSYKGTTLGLISYDTLVCTFDRDIKHHNAVLNIRGWYSRTTCNHINDFILYVAGIEKRFTKKDIENGKSVYIDLINTEQ